jgi:hypothetical protein
VAVGEGAAELAGDDEAVGGCAYEAERRFVFDMVLKNGA